MMIIHLRLSLVCVTAGSWRGGESDVFNYFSTVIHINFVHNLFLHYKILCMMKLLLQNVFSLSLSVVAMASGSDMNQLSFVGLVGMCDPLRPGVKEAVKELLSGEVDVKMITGDAKETGEAIGEIPCYS